AALDHTVIKIFFSFQIPNPSCPMSMTEKHSIDIFNPSLGATAGPFGEYPCEEGNGWILE
ncbi:MAG: hypothetical protein AAB299_09545, partial [Thermodesulfobacteriota bacterium]